MNILLYVIIGVSTQLSFAGNKAVYYDSPNTSLTGVLDLQTFPGPPNYDSITDGDESERHFYLKLDTPVDALPAAGTPALNAQEAEKTIKVVQLSIGEDDLLWKRFRMAGKGARVKVVGEPFHRLNGHHHSRVLLIVKSMEVLK